MKKVPLILTILLLLATAAGAADFAQDLEKLTQHPHRLTGTPEGAEAGRYVEQRLQEIGVPVVLGQEFEFPQVEVKRCEMEVGGQKLPLLPMRSNGLMWPVTPPEGIRGKILYAGLGRPEDYGDRSPAGRIVVLDYNAGDTWLEAFRQGARAVVFAAASPIKEPQVHWVANNANLPRYFFEGDAASLPEDAEAVIHSEIVWEQSSGRSVFGLIRGTEPTFRMGKEEMIILAAPLDSFGEVPHRSPGARGAANVAALLQIASELVQNPPKRDVLLAFFDGESRSHTGASAFYRALVDEGDVQADVRRQKVEKEQAFLRELEQALPQDNPLAASREVRRELMKRLRQVTETIAGEYADRLFVLRQEKRRLDPGSNDARRQELEAEIERVTEEKTALNDLRRAIQSEELDTADAAGLRRIYDLVLQQTRLRLRELENEARFVQDDLRLKELVGDRFIALHASLLLGDSSNHWGLMIGGDSQMTSPQDNPGFYVWIQSLFLRNWRELAEKNAAPPGFEIASADGSVSPPRILWSAPFLIHSGEVAGRFGVYNLAFGTTQERLPREGSPADTVQALRFENIQSQASEVAVLLQAAASDPAFSRSSVIQKDWEFQLDKPAMGRRQGNPLPNRPMVDTTVQIRMKEPSGVVYQPRKMTAFEDFMAVRTNRNGTYSYGPTSLEQWRVKGFALTTNERGELLASSDTATFSSPTTRLNMFYGRQGSAVLAADVQGEMKVGWDQAITHTAVMEAASDSLLDTTKSFSMTMDGVVTWFVEDRVDSVKLFNLNDIAVLGIRETPTKAEAEEWAGPATRETAGTGIEVGEGYSPVDTLARSSVDLYQLNESRISILRGSGILGRSVEELHGRADDLIQQGEATDDTALRGALQTSAFMSSRPVYRDVRQMLDDLVKAVLILLALAVPFAFALERLLIGSTSIYKQIMWFVGFFVATFLLLYFTHPAFEISKAPIIIFLGFALVVLSVLVIFIIMQKFEVELKVLQGMTTTVHLADVSRFGTIMAAMGMGISTMRRRPLRTALTAITVVLLTFTILGFASFGTHTDVVKLYVMPPPPYSGVMVRQVNWNPLNQDVLNLIEGRWGDEATVTGRYWIAPDTNRPYGVAVSRADGTQSLAMRGVLGIEPGELEHRADLSRLLGVQGAPREGMAWITRAVASRLKAKPGDEIMVGGVPLEVGPLLDPVAVVSVVDTDGSSILPVDFIEMSARQQPAQQEGSEGSTQEQSWSSLPIDSVVITSASAAREMGGQLHAINAYTPSVAAAADLSAELARIVPLPVAGTLPEGVYRHVLGPVLEASGVADLFFPILLGGLVIFGTMLGSVTDREKEIYTFSAIGLAPQHVAGLFFAEAMVFSVIGGMGGYLTAQGAMGVVNWLADLGLMRVPEMNYSSTHAIITILIVMMTVLVSAIYPAVKASRSANPGVLRSWKLPRPEGNVMDMRFPFTVSAYDITGVVSFLKEHFDNLSDTGIGQFMAQDTELIQEGENLGLRSYLALAPFDLGVTQDFELRSIESEIPGIDEVKIRLERRSGQPRDWVRLNRVLLDDLRKQFLIWRSLPHDTMEIYRQRTLEGMGATAGANETSKEEASSHV